MGKPIRGGICKFSNCEAAAGESSNPCLFKELPQLSSFRLVLPRHQLASLYVIQRPSIRFLKSLREAKIPSMLRQTHHERDQLFTARPKLVEGLIQRFLQFRVMVSSKRNSFPVNVRLPRRRITHLWHQPRPITSVYQPLERFQFSSAAQACVIFGIADKLIALSSLQKSIMTANR